MASLSRRFSSVSLLASHNGVTVRLFAAALTAILAIGFAATATTADEDAFTVFKLNVPGKLLQHWVEDLDGNGLEDILVIHRKGLEPNETRWVSVFWQDADKGFATAPDQSWEIDHDAGVLDIGDVAGDARKEIVYLTAKGVRYYPINGGLYLYESKRLFDTTGIVVFPSKRTIPMIDFVRDWNENGSDDVAIATFKGLHIHKRLDDDTFELNNTIDIEPETGIYRVRSHGRDKRTAGLRASYTFPNVSVLDFNADGLKDIIASTDDRVLVYLCGTDGLFETEPSTNHLFDIRTQEEKIEDQAEIETYIEDLNQDGYADAFITKQTSKGITNFRGVVNIFWGRAGGFNTEPDQLLISEGTASAGTVFLDVNGDDRKDLILPSIQFSIAAIIRFLMSRSIKVNFNIFLLHEDDRFSERPDFTKEVKFKIDFSGESDDQAMDLEGDYNADKRTDFVFATDKDELSIFLGEPAGGDRLFSKKPVTKVGADAYGELSTYDLNNDGHADMIIHYPENKELKGTLAVLINRAILR